ncbi:MAG: hypothetical protein IKI37_01880 [Oscillospiraceae bacterium]|nr:hypothetical protein [Oscillospiraceae bacterium]MBR7083916.1 hypothetical protein [Oscillospiraceae bacterium]
MTSPLTLSLWHGQECITRSQCLSFSLDKEIYTPYDTLSAEFLADSVDYSLIDRISLDFETACIFNGLPDEIRQYQKNHTAFVRIKSKSFTSLLLQNELEAGMHSNLTVESLLTSFYQFPFVTYENLSGSGYIFVKAGNTMWDGVVSFGYKLTGHYPYVLQNHICFSPPQNRPEHSFTANQILESGSEFNTTRLISHYHMEDILGNPNGYQQENPFASGLHIVRHKQIPFDNSFRHDPDSALTFRNHYSNRASRAKYLIYNGFRNETLGDSISYNTFIQSQPLCRMHASFSANGFRTMLWCYQDSFY